MIGWGITNALLPQGSMDTVTAVPGGCVQQQKMVLGCLDSVSGPYLPQPSSIPGSLTPFGFVHSCARTVPIRNNSPPVLLKKFLVGVALGRQQALHISELLPKP